MPDALPIAAATQERFESAQGRGGDIVLDALGVLFGRLGGNPDGHQQVHHQPVTVPHPLGQSFARLGEKHAAVGPGGGEATREQR